MTFPIEFVGTDRYRGPYVTQSDLDSSLLLKIMTLLGEFRGKRPGYPLETGEMMDLVPAEVGGGVAALSHLDRHVDFLRDIRLLSTGQAGTYRTLQLTAKGQMFVQPELASFGNQELWPEVLKALEKNVQILTYPQETKDGMLYRLREAVAKQAPDVIAKVIAEVSAKILTGGPK
jgi:hypothetical protein